MKVWEEMKADPAYAEFFRTHQQMLVEARRQREAGEIMPAGRLSEGRNDYRNYKLGNDWSR